MASVFQRLATPKLAAQRRTQFDGVLDPQRFKALAEPTRARLLSCLLKCGRPCSVTEVAECCSIDFSMVARHLATLARAGLLDAEKQGRTVWYSANADALATWFRDLAESVEALRPGDGCCERGDPGCGPKKRGRS